MTYTGTKVYGRSSLSCFFACFGVAGLNPTQATVHIQLIHLIY